MTRAPNGRILPNTRLVNGQKERLCSGPAHDEPVWLPETEKYFFPRRTGRQAGTFVYQCRLCRNWTRVKSPGLAGYVPDHRVQPFVIEGVHKVGMSEFARRTGVAERRLKQIMHEPYRRVQKRVVRRIMLEVISIRRKHEVRHRDSIKAGRLARGLSEKRVTSKEHLYVPDGDSEHEVDNLRQKQKRAKMTPKEYAAYLQSERDRKKRIRLTREAAEVT